MAEDAPVAEDVPSTTATTTGRPGTRPGGTVAASRREGRRIALEALFEAEFGQRPAVAALERALAEEPDPAARDHARDLVTAVVLQRDVIDARIEELAPRYAVVQLARIDRTLLRLALGELLHCPTTPARVAIAEWVELARSYSGEPARRLLNGVLGRVVREASDQAGTRPDGGHG